MPPGCTRPALRRRAPIRASRARARTRREIDVVSWQKSPGWLETTVPHGPPSAYPYAQADPGIRFERTALGEFRNRAAIHRAPIMIPRQRIYPPNPERRSGPRRDDPRRTRRPARYESPPAREVFDKTTKIFPPTGVWFRPCRAGIGDRVIGGRLDDPSHAIGGPRRRRTDHRRFRGRGEPCATGWARRLRDLGARAPVRTVPVTGGEPPHRRLRGATRRGFSE